MKRLWVILGALAMVCALTVGTAEANPRVKVVQSLPWLSPNSAVPSGAFATSSGTQPLASAALDTTGIFSLVNASIQGSGGDSDGWTVSDSILVGYIIAYSDSSADGANTLTAATATIEASGDGTDWAAVGTVTVSATSDDPMVAFPLWFKGADHQNLLVGSPMLRVRFASVTGILTACRLKLVYWKDTVLEPVYTTVPWWLENSGLTAFENSFTTHPLNDEDDVDTTGVFSLQNAYADGPGSWGDAAYNDSLLLAQIVVYQDSTADAANTLTAATATIDVSGDGNDWVAAGTVVGIAASDDPIVVFPLGQQLMGTIGNAAKAGALLGNAPIARIRFTSVTGTLTAARVKLLYWRIPNL